MKFRAKPNSGNEGSEVTDIDDSKTDIESNDSKVSYFILIIHTNLNYNQFVLINILGCWWFSNKYNERK